MGIRSSRCGRFNGRNQRRIRKEMTQRKISPNLKDVLLDQDIDQLYEAKVEMSRHNNSGSFVTIRHPEIFTGRVSVSANGTSGIATNPAFPSNLTNIRHAEAGVRALG